jgi:hypothetical protein
VRCIAAVQRVQETAGKTLPELPEPMQ